MATIPKDVILATLEDLDSGKIWKLGLKPDSGCHFADRFAHGGFEIRLRLDWTAIDNNGDPCLDADFFPPGSSKPDRKMKRDPAHHTRKTQNSATGQWAYEFEYFGLRLCFLLPITREKTILGIARIVEA